MTGIRIGLIALTALLTSGATTFAQAPAPSFAKDIQPLLANYCTECHGMGQAKAGYKLETYADLIKAAKKGAAVVPGKPEQSMLIKTMNGMAKKMPPAKYGKNPSAKEIAKIKDWITAGAKDDSKAAQAEPPLPALAWLTPLLPPSTFAFRENPHEQDD